MLKSIKNNSMGKEVEKEAKKYVKKDCNGTKISATTTPNKKAHAMINMVTVFMTIVYHT